MARKRLNIRIQVTYTWNGDNMKNISSILSIMISLLFSLSCDEVVNEHSPQVTPEIFAIGADSVIIKWNDVGDEYYYSIWLSKDSLNDNSFLNAVSVCDSTGDTIYTIRNLQSATFYKVKIRTIGGNKAPNESWPPLRFKTE